MALLRRETEPTGGPARPSSGQLPRWVLLRASGIFSRAGRKHEHCGEEKSTPYTIVEASSAGEDLYVRHADLRVGNAAVARFADNLRWLLVGIAREAHRLCSPALNEECGGWNGFSLAIPAGATTRRASHIHGSEECDDVRWIAAASIPEDAKRLPARVVPLRWGVSD